MEESSPLRQAMAEGEHSAYLASGFQQEGPFNSDTEGAPSLVGRCTCILEVKCHSRAGSPLNQSVEAHMAQHTKASGQLGYRPKGFSLKNDADYIAEASPSPLVSSPNPVSLFIVSRPGFPALVTDTQLPEYAEQGTRDGPKCLSMSHSLFDYFFKDL